MGAMSDLGAGLDRSTAPSEAVRAAAVAYLERSGTADVAQALGLADDPVADLARRAKAVGDMRGKPQTQARPAGRCEATTEHRDATVRCTKDAVDHPHHLSSRAGWDVTWT